MGNQKTLPTPEPKPEPVVTPSVQPAPEVEPVERAERSLLGFRPDDTLSGAGTPPSDGGALNGSGLIHPTGIRHRAALARSLQRRRGNAFVQRAVLQRKAAQADADVSDQAVSSALADRSSGRPLDPTTQRDLEPLFGHSFGDVRVHTDACAGELAKGIQAEAFTRERDMYFSPGQYAPGTSDGRKLIAHELTHVLQQEGGETGQVRTVVGLPNDSFEREAHSAAKAVESGGSVTVRQVDSAPMVQRRSTVHLQPTREERFKAETQRIAEEARTGLGPTAHVVSTLRTIQEPQITGGIIRYDTAVVVMETGPQFELRLARPTVVRLVYTIHFRSDTGIEGTVRIRGTAYFGAMRPYWPPTNDISSIVNRTASQVNIELPEFKRTQPSFAFRIFPGFKGADRSLAEATAEATAKRAMGALVDFDLAPQKQFDRLVSLAARLPPEPVKTPEEQAEERRGVEYPSQEEFKQLTEEEKRALARSKMWEEFSVPNVLIDIAIGLVVLLLSIAAVIAAIAGFKALAIGLAAVTIGALVAGLAYLIYAAVQDLMERWQHREYSQGILTVVKYVLLIVGIIVGVILLIKAVAAALAGAAISLTALIVLGVVLLVAAASAALILVFLDLDNASKSSRVEEFERSVKRAARGIEETFTNLILLILSFILGPLARRLVPVREKPPLIEHLPEERPIIIEERQRVKPLIRVKPAPEPTRLSVAKDTPGHPARADVIKLGERVRSIAHKSYEAVSNRTATSKEAIRAYKEIDAGRDFSGSEFGKAVEAEMNLRLQEIEPDLVYQRQVAVPDKGLTHEQPGRPDWRLSLGGGDEAVMDVTGSGSEGKAFTKYSAPDWNKFVIEIVYPRPSHVGVIKISPSPTPSPAAPVPTQ